MALRTNLHDVGSMRAVVISVDVVIVRLDDHQPGPEGALIAVERVVDVEAAEELGAEEHQRLLLGQLLEPENLKVPVEGAVQQLRDVRRHLDLHDGRARARLAAARPNYRFVRAAT